MPRPGNQSNLLILIHVLRNTVSTKTWRLCQSEKKDLNILISSRAKRAGQGASHLRYHVGLITSFFRRNLINIVLQRGLLSQAACWVLTAEFHPANILQRCDHHPSKQQLLPYDIGNEVKPWYTKNSGHGKTDDDLKHLEGFNLHWMGQKQRAYETRQLTWQVGLSSIFRLMKSSTWRIVASPDTRT